MKNPYLHRAMCIGDPPPNRKTQAAACRRFSLSKISLIEAVEDLQAYVLRHPYAGIAHRHECVVRDERYLSSNFARLRRVTNCIVQKYSEQAL